MSYLLDTSAIIRFVRGNGMAIARIRDLDESGETLGCCAVVVAEFYSGISYGQRPMWDELMVSLVFWPVTRLTAIQAGAYRRESLLRNKRLSVADTLIAATAYEQNATLLTVNPRDFPMDDIRVEAIG